MIGLNLNDRLLVLFFLMIFVSLIAFLKLGFFNYWRQLLLSRLSLFGLLLKLLALLLLISLADECSHS